MSGSAPGARSLLTAIRWRMNWPIADRRLCHTVNPRLLTLGPRKTAALDVMGHNANFERAPDRRTPWSSNSSCATQTGTWFWRYRIVVPA